MKTLVRTKMTDEQLKEIYNRLKSKGDFAISLAKRVERSPRTITNHWFSDLPLSGNMPKDKKTRTIIISELKRAPKKEE